MEVAEEGLIIPNIVSMRFIADIVESRDVQASENWQRERVGEERNANGRVDHEVGNLAWSVG
jgi:hypothetical protein